MKDSASVSQTQVSSPSRGGRRGPGCSVTPPALSHPYALGEYYNRLAPGNQATPPWDIPCKHRDEKGKPFSCCLKEENQRVRGKWQWSCKCSPGPYGQDCLSQEHWPSNRAEGVSIMPDSHRPLETWGKTRSVTLSWRATSWRDLGTFELHMT